VIGRYVPLLLSSLRRKRVRTFFTVASIFVAFLLYGLAASMRYALQSGVEVAGADRLMTMHKISFMMELPASYENRIRTVPGVIDVSAQTWFGAWFRDEREQIPAFPVDPAPFLRIYREYVVPSDQRDAWIADRTGILIGRSLAQTYGWKIGDKVPLRSAIWRRMDGSDVWEVNVRAIFDLSNNGDTRAILLHQDYFEEARAIGKGQAGWYVVQVNDINRMQAIAKQIDGMFANSPAETKTSSERAMAQSFVNQIGNIGKILSAIVGAVFFTMLLVTANTMAQSVRERTNEIGVLKTLGFTNQGVLGLVLSESVLLTVVGAALGVAAAWWVGVQFASVFQQYLPGFGVPPESMVRAALYATGLGLLAGAAPALQAMQLRIVEALRRD